MDIYPPYGDLLPCLPTPYTGIYVNLMTPPIHLTHYLRDMDRHKTGIMEVYIIDFQVSHQYVFRLFGHKPKIASAANPL